MTAPKAHIYQSEIPISEGLDLTAICGITLRSVVYAYCWDSSIAPEFLSSLSTLNTCKTCYRILLSKRYIYGVISREHLDRIKTGAVGEEVAA